MKLMAEMVVVTLMIPVVIIMSMVIGAWGAITVLPSVYRDTWNGVPL